MPAKTTRSVQTAVEVYSLPDTTTREEASVNVRTAWNGVQYDVIVSAYQVRGSEAVYDVDQVIGHLFRNTDLPQSREWVLTYVEGPMHLHGHSNYRACPTLSSALSTAARVYARGLLLDARQDAREDAALAVWEAAAKASAKPATSQPDHEAHDLAEQHGDHLRLLAKTLDGAEFFTRDEPARVVIDGEATVTKHYYRFPGDTEDSEGYGTSVGAYWSARQRAEILALQEEAKA